MGHRALPRLSVVVAVSVAFALLLSACGSSGGGEAEVSKNVTLSLSAEPATLDPAKAFTQGEAVVAEALYDTLVRKDSAGKVVPGLAESWTVKPESVTLKLRGGVTCSDGSKLTATDVADSLTRLADPKTEAQGAAVTFGGHAMEAEGDDAAGTVTVSVDSPWSELLDGLSLPWAGVICPAGLKDPSALAQESFGTGPYVLTSVAHGRSIGMKRRQGYDWAPDLGKLGAGTPPSTVTLRIVANESTTANLMLSGELDGGLLQGPDIARLEQSSDFSIQEEAAGTSWLSFNQAAGKPLADPATRLAIAEAIDRSAFLQAANDGRGELTTAPVAPAVPCAYKSEAAIPETDPEAAKAALADKHLSLAIVGTTQVADGAGTQYIQAALEEIGVTASLHNSDTTNWSTELFSGEGKWDLTVLYALNPTASMFTPMSLLVGEPAPQGTNFSSIENAAVAQAVAEATTKLGSAGCAAWERAQEELVKSTNILPLATLPVSIILRNGLTGVVPQGGLLDLGTLRVG